jgi:hypothetical protein
LSAGVVLAVVLAGFLALVGGRAVMMTIALRRSSVQPMQREHDMERVASYLALSPAGTALLPDRAWRDLDMDEVFRRLDRTVGWPGQHLLYQRLRREDHSFEALRRFELGVGRLADDAATTATIRRALQPLDERRAAALPTLFDGTLPALPGAARLLVLLTVAALGCAIGAFWWPTLVIPLCIVVAANLLVRPWMGLRIAGALPAMRALPSLHRAAQALSTLQAPELAAPVETLRRGAPPLRMIARAARWLSVEPAGAAELVSYLFAYVNLVFLLDVSAFVWSEAAMRAHASTLRAVYEALGELDAMQAVATLRAEATRWCRPVFVPTPERTLVFAGLTHPLLDAPVANSVEMRGRSMLLTGSNMSGKSTFIRTVGVNAILARSIHTVFGERWHAPRWAVRTSIGRADSILEGTSYYRAEVEAMGELLARRGAEPALVLIDELFRGTNSVERVAAAKAVLEALDRGDDLIIVATHDVELLAMLPGYASFHFREEVRDGALHFDYRLHDGPSSTRNALAILELAGYPAEVVAEARRLAEERDGDRAASVAIPV